MKYQYIKNAVLFFVLLSVLSCSNASLTEINPNEPPVKWESLTDTQKGINSVYNSMLNEDLLGIVQEAWRSDMGYPGYGRPIPRYTIPAIMYFQTYTNNYQFIGDKWNACYTTIYYANQVIKGLNSLLPSLPDSQLKNWEAQMGQVKFVRGLMHFYLHSTYNNGEIIIADTIQTVATGFDKGTSSSSEVKDFFRKDLEYAYANLPETYSSDLLGSATKWAAASALGTSYLYEATDGSSATGDYTKAMTYFQAILDSNQYDLVTDMSLMFTKGGEFNKESIFELAYNTEHRQNFTVYAPGKMSQTLSYYATGSQGYYVPVWLISAYKKEVMDDNDSRNKYNEADGSSTKLPISLRAAAMVAIVNDELSDYGGKKTPVALNAKLGNGGYGLGYYKKYVDFDESDPRGTQSAGTNVVVTRLAEIYLMQAECLIQTGDLAGGLELINKIRHRWALELLGPPIGEFSGARFESDKNDDGIVDADYVPYTQETLMNRLMYFEKPLELSVEGHAVRWIDLRRWGIAQSNFDKLAGETFYAEKYTYPERDPVTGVKTGVMTTSGSNADILDVDPNITNNTVIIDYEYKQAAVNFNPAVNNYYPIPLTEILRNPALK